MTVSLAIQFEFAKLKNFCLGCSTIYPGLDQRLITAMGMTERILFRDETVRKSVQNQSSLIAQEVCTPQMQFNSFKDFKQPRRGINYCQ